MEHILGKLLLPTLGVINLKSLVRVFVKLDNLDKLDKFDILDELKE